MIFHCQRLDACRFRLRQHMSARVFQLQVGFGECHGRLISRIKSAYYTPKPKECPQIRIIKTMGPQKKRPVISRFQILGVLGQNAICLLHPPLVLLKLSRRECSCKASNRAQFHGYSKFYGYSKFPIFPLFRIYIYVYNIHV